jgi:hypothetical protein
MKNQKDPAFVSQIRKFTENSFSLVDNFLFYEFQEFEKESEGKVLNLGKHLIREGSVQLTSLEHLGSYVS